MADDAPTTTPAAVSAPEEISSRPVESGPSQDGPTTEGDATKNASSAEDAQDNKKDQEDTANTNGASVPEESSNDTTQVAESSGAADPTAISTPVSTKKTGKRKSSAGVPEHKGKKTPKGKKAPELHLDVKPGELWFARMKGHSAWPAIVCDEEMLPESLLQKRPVSAAGADGTYREDFRAGGKNARDRRYPIMFLGTNEFSWLVNTDLQPLDLGDIKSTFATGDRGKKSVQLWGAYGVAAEGHDLAWFKAMLADHEAAMRQDAEEKEQKALEKEEKKAKKERRKSEKDLDEDVDMEDAAEGDTKKKPSKKRKKEAEDNDDEETVSKTPRTKLKVNGPKTPATETTKPKSIKKSVKKATKTEPEDETPKLTEAEKREKRSKTVLYLRHRLQKGFLAKEGPKEEDMEAMDGHFKQLEQYEDLEQEIIKETKIHKVLKNIVRLDPVPRDADFKFKERSSALLEVWNKTMNVENGTPAVADAPKASTNGVAEIEKTVEATTNGKEESVPAKEETEAKSIEATKTVDTDMPDVKNDEPSKTGTEAEATAVETTEA